METQIYLQTMEELIPLPIALKTYINGILSELHFRKNTLIAVTNFAAFESAIIISGSLRLIKIEEFDSTQTTLYIYLEGDFIPHQTVGKNFGDSLYFYFLKDTTIQGLSPEYLPTLFKVFPEYVTIQEKISARIVSELLLHLVCLSGTKSNQRFKHFIKVHKEIDRTVVQKYIASFLGMDIKTFNRLRAENAKKG